MSKELDNFIEDCTSKEFLEIYHFFTKEQLIIIQKLGQKVEDKKYTIYEFDNLEDDIINYLKYPEKLTEKGISREAYQELINTFKKICEKYDL